ncbi:MAG: sulfatase-like hydrolase/transferase [Clostridiales bacterium]|nr:sulfatase-like hydrolase/transferase [Clostridiales bacterium]
MIKVHIYRLSRWVGALMILMMPFFLETLVWPRCDVGTHPEFLDFGLAALLSLGFLVLFWVFLRSLDKAANWAFGATVFFTSLMESRNLSIFDAFPSGKIMYMVKVGICSGIAFGVAFLAFHMARFLIRKNIGFILSTFLSFIIIVSNFMPTFSDATKGNNPQTPHIIFIIMDTARADHLSLYGYHRKTTPFLEKLAENAAVYEKAISPAPWTPSAHASLLTGLLPAEHGTDGDFLMFDPPHPSLAEVLKGLGYKTTAIVNNPQLDPAFGWNRGFDYYGVTWKAPRTSIARARWIFKRRPEDWIWTGNSLRTVATAKRWWIFNCRHPKFLFLNFIDPHSPYGDFHPYKNFKRCHRKGFRYL